MGVEEILAILTVLKPVLAEIIVDLVERYESDPQFQKDLEQARDSVKNAQTKEEKLDAAKAYQDALFR